MGGTMFARSSRAPQPHRQASRFVQSPRPLSQRPSFLVVAAQAQPPAQRSQPAIQRNEALPLRQPVRAEAATASPALGSQLYDPFPAVDTPDSRPASSAAAAKQPSDAESGFGSPVLFRRLTYAVNGAALAAASLAAASQVMDLSWAGSAADTLSGWWSMYSSALVAHPIALQGMISGTVYGLGDATAQAYEGRSLPQIDFMRMMRSASIGLFIHGPLSHFIYSSDGSMIDSFVQQAEALDPWQQVLAKVAVDQTAYSCLWNLLYFGLLGMLRGDSPGAILTDLRTSGFSLLKAGWRLWPFAHVATYALIPPEHRLLYVDMVELAWVTILLAYKSQTAEWDDGEDGSLWSESDIDAPECALESSAAGEMRVLLMENEGAAVTE